MQLSEHSLSQYIVKYFDFRQNVISFFVEAIVVQLKVFLRSQAHSPEICRGISSFCLFSMFRLYFFLLFRLPVSIALGFAFSYQGFLLNLKVFPFLLPNIKLNPFIILLIPVILFVMGLFIFKDTINPYYGLLKNANFSIKRSND